jgi:ribosomal protein S18 acetylase RimI-like enzyme
VGTTGRAPRLSSSTEVDTLSAVLAEAFEDDPVFGWLLPNQASRRRRLEGFFQLELRHVVLPTGRVWTTDGSAGASLEVPPGQWRMPVRTQLAQGPAFTRVFGTRIGHALALITKMEHRHLREPHYYIPYIGVVPEAQGQGLGTSLLEPTLERCDRERVPAYLEATNERNAALYARLGFEHLGEFALGSCPPLWAMRREPRSS